MASIRTENLTKVFSSGSNRIVAADSVDLTIEDGTFVTLLGPSGCGKTTLLRMLGGLETPTQGTVYYDDEDVTDRSVQDRRISMVFQSIALFPFKTVRKNIEYGLKYTDTDAEAREEKAREMAEMVGIEELLDQKPNQLSGGQQQRVALSRALIRDPTVFLLDEPMSDLDAELKIDLRAELKELHNEFQTTTLYVTHDQEEAMTLSEEVIVMQDGEVQQMSPPYELYSEPDNMFVARFIGSPNINFFPAALDGTTIDVSGFDESIEVSQETATAIEQGHTGDGLQIGLRPSELEMVDDLADADFRTETTIYEQLGDETILHSRMSVDGVEQEVRAMVPPEFTPGDGTEVGFTFSPSDVHVFDDQTGDAILNGLTPTRNPTGIEGKGRT
jgi:multiple sugar transport system ATP-binding protein